MLADRLLVAEVVIVLQEAMEERLVGRAPHQLNVDRS
jgi:hypothetical protein